MTTDPNTSTRNTALQRLMIRNHVHISGTGSRTIVFAHGFGCDQSMWRFVAPHFESSYRVVLLDHVGSGHSDRNAYRVDRYSNLSGYALDLLEILGGLKLREIVFVGHSVSAMIGLLAARLEPARFGCLVMVGASPCYINSGDYFGGFTRQDVDELLELLETNHAQWSQQMAPLAMSNADRPELAQELANSLCNMHPLVARQFARATFLSDHRALLSRFPIPTLVLQCTDDTIAPVAVGRYLQHELPLAQLVVMRATGHCPHLSAPQETVAAIQEYLSGLERQAVAFNG